MRLFVLENMELKDYLTSLEYRELDLLIAKKVLNLEDVQVERSKRAKDRKHHVLRITVPKIVLKKRRYRTYINKFNRPTRTGLPRYSVVTRDCFLLLKELLKKKLIKRYSIFADRGSFTVRVDNHEITSDNMEKSLIICVLLNLLDLDENQIE